MSTKKTDWLPLIQPGKWLPTWYILRVYCPTPPGPSSYGSLIKISTPLPAPLLSSRLFFYTWNGKGREKTINVSVIVVVKLASIMYGYLILSYGYHIQLSDPIFFHCQWQWNSILFNHYHLGSFSTLDLMLWMTLGSDNLCVLSKTENYSSENVWIKCDESAYVFCVCVHRYR